MRELLAEPRATCMLLQARFLMLVYHMCLSLHWFNDPDCSCSVTHASNSEEMAGNWCL